ncbi:energy transducer TonB [Franzmannia qiaohouensis]|uniref:energy transducer TonB n=1 Tax=Franzmannia qiaohouensis TaxID=1329370 RepID=UPI003BEF0421
MNLVRRSVQQAWVIPPGTESGAGVEVAVRLGPTGELYSASITQSSGNADVDRSVLLAVDAAAPFPKIRQLPASLQQDYRQFNLRFAPGGDRG